MISRIAQKSYFKFVTLFLVSSITSLVTLTGLCAGIVNGDFSDSNNGFTTAYSFISSGTSTSPDTFAVRTVSQDFNPGYDLFGDHTTGSGGMMLVDGDAGPVVWQEVVSVTPGTNYTFSVWVTPANSSNPSVLTFSVNGVQVGASLVLTNTPGVWQQFTGVWSSGAATSATLTIVDQNGISLGNDFALDDISFNPGATPGVIANIYTAVEITWPSQASVSYQVQYRTNAGSSTWFNLGMPVTGTGTNNSAFDSTRGQAAKFYRVIVAP